MWKKTKTRSFEKVTALGQDDADLSGLKVSVTRCFFFQRPNAFFASPKAPPDGRNRVQNAQNTISRDEVSTYEAPHLKQSAVIPSWCKL